jgi:hypothetical protein
MEETIGMNSQTRAAGEMMVRALERPPASNEVRPLEIRRENDERR